VSRHVLFIIFIGARVAASQFVYNIYQRSVNTLHVRKVHRDLFMIFIGDLSTPYMFEKHAAVCL